MKDTLLSKIHDRSALVGIVGLGYVGLPLVQAFSAAGFRTLGLDIDHDKVVSLLSGQSYIGHLSGEWFADQIAAGQFAPTEDMDRLAEPDVILICVPTPLTESRDPDLQFVETTCAAIARVLRPGQLVVLESTTYPGTTRDVVLPILRRADLELGRDFFLAYSPEREDPGNADHTARVIPKVVGGAEPHSLELADALYTSAVVKTVPVSSCEVAEASKIVENTYRSVNIAMINELKVLFDRIDIDVWDVIEAAKTKPFGYQAFYPGPGLGGHCIPIDPFYLSWIARRHGSQARFIELAGEINTSMPAYVVGKLTEALNEFRKPIHGSKITILGVAYKPNVDDPRESPAFELMERLLARGAVLRYSDPHVPRLPKMRGHDLPDLESVALTPESLAEADCLLIVTDHAAFNYEEIVRYGRLIVDTRNATRNVELGREKIRKA